MTEVDLLQHARAWTKAWASFGSPFSEARNLTTNDLYQFCLGMSKAYEALADEQRAERVRYKQLAETAGKPGAS